MRFPSELYQVQEEIEARFPELRRTQQRGLAMWVYGTIMAGSSTESAVLSALSLDGQMETRRTQLRDWLYDGIDKSAPCTTELDITTCYIPLLRWVLSLWQGTELALAVDVTNHKERFHVLCVSVLYGGCAIPVAWHLLRGGTKGAWMPHLCRLLDTLAPAVPRDMTVLVLIDRGLRSPTLWDTICSHGWHPLMRLQQNTVFRPAGWRRHHPARDVVRALDTAWVGQGQCFSRSTRQGTLLVLWLTGAKEPWIVLTDLPPEQAGIAWYGLRTWIELGFRVIKSVGFQWQHTRRSDPTREARHWLVLAIAVLLTQAVGTRVEDALARGLLPVRLRTPPKQRPATTRRRTVSLFRRGLQMLQLLFAQRRYWTRLWLTPDPWPGPPPGIAIFYHAGSP
jgi:hypothetical protein